MLARVLRKMKDATLKYEEPITDVALYICRMLDAVAGATQERVTELLQYAPRFAAWAGQTESPPDVPAHVFAAVEQLERT